jgi:hypothetical protein
MHIVQPGNAATIAFVARPNEKLQSDQVNLKRYIETLEKTQQFLSEDHEPPRRGRNSRRMAMLEMLINAQNQNACGYHARCMTAQTSALEFYCASGNCFTAF